MAVAAKNAGILEFIPHCGARVSMSRCCTCTTTCSVRHQCYCCYAAVVPNLLARSPVKVLSLGLVVSDLSPAVFGRCRCRCNSARQSSSRFLTTSSGDDTLTREQASRPADRLDELRWRQCKTRQHSSGSSTNLAGGSPALVAVVAWGQFMSAGRSFFVGVLFQLL